MSIGYAIGNVVLAARAYENWAEVIAYTARRQEPPKLMLKNGYTIEAEIGLRFLVREIFFERVYNPSYLPMEENDIVVDIGANDGVFTLFAASITRNAIHSFEPSPRNLEVLRRNITVNGLHHVIDHGCAVSDEVGFAKLLLDPIDGQRNRLSDHIIHSKNEEFKILANLNNPISGLDEVKTYIEVPTTTLQEIMDCNNFEKIDFLKMDCEGSEGSILISTSVDYLQRIRKIALEFHDHLSELNHRDIQNLLERSGFFTKLKWDRKSPIGYIYAWR